MMSSLTVQLQQGGSEDSASATTRNENTSETVTTLHKIYKDGQETDDISFLKVDPATRRSFINKSAYAKLHRSLSTPNNRRSVDSLKFRYEVAGLKAVRPPRIEEAKPKEKTKPALNDEEVERLKTKYSPASFGYPKPAPLPKPRHLMRSVSDQSKDENSNDLGNEDDLIDYDERKVILRQSASEESVDKIAKELSNFTMDKKPKKRNNSFRKLFSGSFFGKDKKKKEEEKNRLRAGDRDNMQNETNLNNSQVETNLNNGRTVQTGQNGQANQNVAGPNYDNAPRLTEEQMAGLEQQYADMHINRFNQIRQNFTEQNRQEQVPMEVAKKKSISDFISSPVNKYIDTSSSTSTESGSQNVSLKQTNLGNFRDTPPRVQESYQNSRGSFRDASPRIQDNFVTPPVKESYRNSREAAPRTQDAYQNVGRTQEAYQNASRTQDAYQVTRDVPTRTQDGSQNTREAYRNSRDAALRPQEAYQNIGRPQDAYQNSSRDTPPRAQETYQNIKLVRPKATIPLSSERPLPNPYQNEKASPRTIERNLNRSNVKEYPDKPSLGQRPHFNDSYGTVFDSLEYARSRNGARPPDSPKSPSLEGSKLKLPPNREIYSLQPRVKSPIPSNRVSTEKIIATELLRSSRSPTPQRKNAPDEEVVKAKPPMSPKILQRKPSDSSLNQSPDRMVTNVVVHNAPQKPARSSTPVDMRASPSLKLSPQKEDIRRSVEEYYWKELKKMKEQEDYNLYMMQLSNGYLDEDLSRVRRSRSLSPSQRGRRSLSLPRDPRVEYVDYGRLPTPQSIPEDRTLVIDGYEPKYQNFARTNPRSDSLQRPIFRRGSLNRQDVHEPQPQYKKVSFSSLQQPAQAWPTKNGFTQSPPQRRLEKRESVLDDDVFLPNAPRSREPDGIYGQNRGGEPVYGPRSRDNPDGLYVQSRSGEPVYSTRVVPRYPMQQAPRYQVVHSTQQIGPRRLSMDSLPRARQEVYVTQVDPRRREIIFKDDVYGQFGGYQQQPQRANPVYSSRQSIADPIYAQKQVTVSNKFCDIYGQIHDSTPQQGVIMGQLQPPSSYTQLPQNFVRGTRLTASANDMGRRLQNQRFDAIRYEDVPLANYDTRPLPPIPTRRRVPPPVSDTESGSDASEVQRIMQSKAKNKKRGLFGK